MKRCMSMCLVAAVCGFVLSSFSLAQDKKDDKAKPPAAKQEGAKKDAGAKPEGAKPEGGAAADMDPAAIAAMMEKLAAVGENHKLLEGFVGEWTFVNKYWMDPSAPPHESTGTASTKAIMGGRYFVQDVKGAMEVPGADGKMVKRDFVGQGTTGFDNAKQKFFNTWLDNMSTGVMLSEGTYDAAKKAFTYHGEMDWGGTKVKVREVIRVIDKDNHVFEWYEMQGPQEVKTMEITYKRAK
ncbi:MAG: hypothetical protein CHACPFDD_03995 [Phycisphaerae bacterium]|nr:hypothetical protein [Phycisphaerae bacterium]